MMNTGFVELDTHEEVIGIFRRPLWWPLRRLLFLLALSLLPIVLFFPLWSFGGGGIAVIIVLVIGLFYLWIRFYIQQTYTMLIVTDQRYIDVDHTGIFQRSVTEIPLIDTEDVLMRKEGLLGKLFDIGSVRVVTVGEDQLDTMFVGVKGPEMVRDFLLEARMFVVEEEDEEGVGEEMEDVFEDEFDDGEDEVFEEEFEEAFSEEEIQEAAAVLESLAEEAESEDGFDDGVEEEFEEAFSEAEIQEAEAVLEALAEEENTESQPFSKRSI